MGNFDALAGEIARRRRNRVMMSALAMIWSLQFVVLFTAPNFGVA